MAKPRFLPATFLACIVALAISSCLAVGTRGAQETPAHPSVLTNPEVNYPLQFDISPALRDMAMALSPETAQALPVRHPKLQQLHAQQSQQPSADGALQTSVLPLVNASINSLSVSIAMAQPKTGACPVGRTVHVGRHEAAA